MTGGREDGIRAAAPLTHDGRPPCIGDRPSAIGKRQTANGNQLTANRQPLTPDHSPGTLSPMSIPPPNTHGETSLEVSPLPSGAEKLM